MGYVTYLENNFCLDVTMIKHRQGGVTSSSALQFSLFISRLTSYSLYLHLHSASFLTTIQPGLLPSVLDPFCFLPKTLSTDKNAKEMIKRVLAKFRR